MFAFASFFSSPLLRASGFKGARCTGVRRVNRTYSRRPVFPVAVIEPFTPETLLLSENITLRIFLGGLGIVASGIAAVLFVGFIIAKNYDEIEQDFWNRDGALDRMRALEKRKEAKKRERKS